MGDPEGSAPCFLRSLACRARAACAAGAVFAQALCACQRPSETALNDHSHAVSPVRSGVERCKTGKMRLLAGFLPSNALGLRGPVHSSGGIVRTVPTLISASMRVERLFGGSCLVFALAAHTTGSFGGAWTLEKNLQITHQAIWQEKAEKAEVSDGVRTALQQKAIRVAAIRRRSDTSTQRDVVAARAALLQKRSTKKI